MPLPTSSETFTRCRTACGTGDRTGHRNKGTVHKTGNWTNGTVDRTGKKSLCKGTFPQAAGPVLSSGEACTLNRRGLYPQSAGPFLSSGEACSLRGYFPVPKKEKKRSTKAGMRMSYVIAESARSPDAVPGMVEIPVPMEFRWYRSPS